MKYVILLALLFSGNAFSMNVTAQSWLVADGEGKMIQGENVMASRSIASITKLMSAIVVLEANQDPKQRLGQFTREQHIQLSLVKSNNQSAKTICDNYPGGHAKCVNAMNEKAMQLGMYDSKFVEATGISAMNTSTATDLVKLVIASKEYPAIVLASQSPQFSIKLKKKWLVFNNTNPIIGKRHNFIVSKTGTTTAAGGCIVMMLDTDIGRRIVVVLGSKSGKTRIPEAEFIALREYDLQADRQP